MNQTPRVGSNEPQPQDFARLEMERLRRDYAETFLVVEELLAEYDTIPEVLQSQDDKDRTTSLIKRIRDTVKSLNGYHELEKLPHFRRGQAVDQTFFGEIDKLAKRDKKANDGAADRLGSRLTDYDIKELARENARRRQAALDARKEADQLLAEAEEAEREAAKARRAQEEAEAAALRARKPENKAQREAEATQAAQAATIANNAVIEKRAEVAVAEHQADQTYIDTLARPADIMRNRSATGTLSTMEQENFARIDNVKELDLEALRSHIRLDALETALNSYARSMRYSSDASVQIKGATFGKRPKSRVR